MTEVQIQIDRIPAETISVPIVSTAPMLMNRMSEKAKKMMLDAMQGRKTPKERKDPDAEYKAALYELKGGGYGFPSTGFKQATVGAARFYGKNVTMTGLRQALFFRGEPGDDGQLMVRIEGEPTMSEFAVTVGQRGKDLRYRPMFTEWSAVLEVTYVASALTRESVVSLIDAGGLGVGIGDWRPERNGTFGTYCVDQTRRVETIVEANS